MKIKLTSVYVDDQEKALRFYTEVLLSSGRPRGWGLRVGGSCREGFPAPVVLG